MHIPTYAGLLRVNVTLILRITTKLLSVSFVTYSLVLMSILNSPFRCLRVLHQLYFSILPLFHHTHQCLLVSTTPSIFFTILFSASIPLCVLNSAYSFSHCDWLDATKGHFFLNSILTLIKVVIFHNEIHALLYQFFLTVPIGI